MGVMVLRDLARLFSLGGAATVLFKPCLHRPPRGRCRQGLSHPRWLGKARPGGLQAAQIVAAGYKIGEAVEGAIPHPLFFGMTQEGQKRDSGYAFS